MKSSKTDRHCYMSVDVPLSLPCVSTLDQALTATVIEEFYVRV